MGKNNNTLLIGALAIGGILLLSRKSDGQTPLNIFGGEAGPGLDVKGLFEGIGGLLDTVKTGTQTALGLDDVNKAINDALGGFGGGGGDGTTPGGGTSGDGGNTTFKEGSDSITRIISAAGETTNELFKLALVGVGGALGIPLLNKVVLPVAGPTAKAVGGFIARTFAGKQGGQVAVRALVPGISTTALLAGGVAAEILGLTQLRGENPGETALSASARANPSYVAYTQTPGSHLSYNVWTQNRVTGKGVTGAPYAPAAYAYSPVIKQQVKTPNKYYVNGKLVYGGAR